MRIPLSEHLADDVIETALAKHKAESSAGGPAKGKRQRTEPVKNTATLERAKRSKILATKSDADIELPKAR